MMEAIITADGEALLMRNLKALSIKSPRLASRLCEPVDNSHVEIACSHDGAPMAQLHMGMSTYPLHPLTDPQAAARKVLESLAIPTHQPVLLLGLGTGYDLEALLRYRVDCFPVYAYERDPWLLRLTLTLHDFARDILAGRIHFLLATDILELAARRTAPLFIWPHAVLGRIYDDESRLFRENSASIPAERAARRVMLVSGGLFVHDVADALHEHGFHTWSWSPMAVSREETLEQIKKLQPRFIFSVNYVKELPELCESLSIPLAIWEIDPTIEYLPPSSGPFRHTTIYTHRKPRRGFYAAAGFKNVDYLPLAANPARRRPVELSEDELRRYGCDISFVGDSMVAQARRLREKWRGAEAGNWERWEATRSESCGLESCRVALDEEGRFIDLRACRAEAAASRWRLRVIRELSAQPWRLNVWGDEDWKEAVADSLQYRGPAGHHEELNRIYGATKINLDMARLYQRDIVTMRVFDILACGGFVLAQHSADLGNLFDVESEVVSYRSLRELKRLVKHFLASENERRALAAEGRRKVLRTHTFQHRMERILTDLGITRDER